MATVTIDQANRFGDEPYRCRTRRRLSQLDLAARAGTTQRYVSYVERGPSAPGRAMVIRLAEPLELSLRERNELLLAAGYAPIYPDFARRRPLRSVRDARIGGHPLVVGLAGFHTGCFPCPTTWWRTDVIMRALDPEVVDAIWAAIEPLLPPRPVPTRWAVIGPGSRTSSASEGS